MKTIKILIAVIFLIGIIGCSETPINTINTNDGDDSQQMSFSIITFDGYDSYSITKLTYDIHSAKKFITWNRGELIEIYLQNQVKYLEVNGCSSFLINTFDGDDSYKIDRLTYDIHDGDKFITWNMGELIEIYLQEQVKYLEVE